MTQGREHSINLSSNSQSDNNSTLVSEHKQAFLADQKFVSYQLTAYEMKVVADKYSKKKNIQLAVNGNRLRFTLYLREKEEEIQREIDTLQDDTKKYAYYLQKFWLAPFDQFGGAYAYFYIDFNHPEFDYEHIQNKIIHFLDGNEDIRKDLTEEELANLNSICEALPGKAKFDNMITKYIAARSTDIKDVGVPKENCFREINHIQSLQNRETKNECPVGYIFTNGHRVKVSHFEVLIVMKDRVIKPVVWNESRERQILGNFFQPRIYLSPETDKSDENNPLSVHQNSWMKESTSVPQADREACGALGLMYLKELLKNDADQLRNYSLMFTYFNRSDPYSNFFFPSPQVLRYSQSGLYNKLIVAMLDDGDEKKVEHKGEVYRVVTLKKLLNDSIIEAKTKEMVEGIDLAKVIEDNQGLLNNLDNFRQRWLAAYKLTNEKRESMQAQIVDRSTFKLAPANVYLAYSSQRMFRFAKNDLDTSAKAQMDISPNFVKK